MKTFGRISGAIGIVLIGIAFLYSPIVPGEDMFTPIFNLQKGQIQMMILHTGIGALISGAVLEGCGAIVEFLETRLRKDAPGSAPAAEPGDWSASDHIG